MERVHSNNIHIIYVRDNRRGQPRMENRDTVSIGLKTQYATQNGKSRDSQHWAQVTIRNPEWKIERHSQRWAQDTIRRQQKTE